MDFFCTAHWDQNPKIKDNVRGKGAGVSMFALTVSGSLVLQYYWVSVCRILVVTVLIVIVVVEVAVVAEIVTNCRHYYWVSVCPQLKLTLRPQ